MHQPIAAVLLALALVLVDGPALPLRAEAIEFESVDNLPLDLRAGPDEAETEALRAFEQTGDNAYRGNEAGVAEGRVLYETYCQRCHKPDGTGGAGPSLVSDEHTYARVATDVGMFEVIYGGASGEMQAFSKRGLTPDQILKIIAYVRSLKRG